MFSVLQTRAELIHKTVELSSLAVSDLMMMGKHIAWIETEPTFAEAIAEARSRDILVRVISVKEYTSERFAQAFEKIGCTVRYYDHGDIRVFLFDRNKALISIPSESTHNSPFPPREYVTIYTDDRSVVTQLCRRFEDMWETS